MEHLVAYAKRSTNCMRRSGLLLVLSRYIFGQSQRTVPFGLHGECS